MILASQKGHQEVVKALIAANADVNAKEAKEVNSFTALILASELGHQEVVQALIAANADVNAKTSYGLTALMAASQNGHHQVVQVLIAAKADVNASAFMRVPQKGHKGMEQTLIIADGVTALMLASQDDHQEVVQALIAANADVNAKDANGTTALMLASQNGHQKVVQILRKAGAVD